MEKFLEGFLQKPEIAFAIAEVAGAFQNSAPDSRKRRKVPIGAEAYKLICPGLEGRCWGLELMEHSPDLPDLREKLP